MDAVTPRFTYDEGMSLRQQRVAMTPDMVAQRGRVRDAIALEAGERVLEVGCGNGLLADEMADEVGLTGHVTGVDISDSMIALARAHCGSRPGIHFATANADRLPFEDASFDVAVTVQCMCFVPDVQKAMSEMFRVLRPGGRLVILETDWDSLVWNSSDPVLMNKMMAIYKSVYQDFKLPRTLTRLLRGAGFFVKSREQFVILNWHFDLDSYSGHQIIFTSAVAEGSVSPDQILAWSESIQSVAQQDAYFFGLNRTIFCAVKPE